MVSVSFAYRAFFFFSSRRRHTRWPRDWSSDVCSSDLGKISGVHVLYCLHGHLKSFRPSFQRKPPAIRTRRSEERRVGKEWRSRGWREQKRRKAQRRRRLKKR